MRRSSALTVLELLIALAFMAIVLTLALPRSIVRGVRPRVGPAIAPCGYRSPDSLFRDDSCEEDANNDYGTLSELSNTALIGSVLGSGTKPGYIFLSAYSFATDEYLWFGTANLLVPGSRGDRYFEVSTRGALCYTTGKSPEHPRD